MPKLTRRQMDEIEQQDLLVLPWLEWLGETPEEIAATFEKLGITGTPVSEDNCPLSCFLNALGFLNPKIYQKHPSIGSGMSIVFDQDFYHRKHMRPKGKDHWTMEFTFRYVPEVVEQFVKKFDNECFPALIA